MNGTDLLAEFRASGSDGAFAELVRRYTNLVYSVARRRLSNDSHAQEVTQLVFIRLAKAVPNLRGDAELVAWLHRTTVHASIDLWRSESRRRLREEHAVVMQTETDSHEDAAWTELAPVLDEALNELSEPERQAILLRFFAGKTMRNLGAVFGISEDAAKMRVSRAMERLRTGLTARGVACGVVALAALLSERAVESAPSQLTITLAALSVPIPASVGTSGVAGMLAQVSRTKIVAGLAALVVVGTATFIFLQGHQASPRAPGANASPGKAPDALNQEASGAATPEVNANGDGGVPDPLKLLQAVARARQRITSGSIEFQLSMDDLTGAFMGWPHTETNHLRLKLLFDGQRLRCESFGREYRYVSVGTEGGESDAAKIREQRLDREAAVRAGLLQAFVAHCVTTCDGAALMLYRETDGRPDGTTIDDPSKGSYTFIFDPRCLGLAVHLSLGNTVENCLGYAEAKSVKLVGKELVDGVATWRIHVLSKHDASLEFWIDAALPARVLKHAYGSSTVVSLYEEINPRNPIPVSVKTMEYRDGAPAAAKRFIQSSAQLNAPVDPTIWSLAGLGMPAGTPVSDNRNHRRIGYWTGFGLSESLPPTKAHQPQIASPNLAELMALLENDPASPEGLGAAAWILLNTPDGPQVDKAAEVILREHLCRELGRVRHKCSRKLIETLIEKNPSAEVQATACFTLATMLKDEADFGRNKKATREAERLFNRVITQFDRVKPNGAELARRAKPELYEVRNLFIGKPAPETEGEDFEGQSMKLSDHRGKVVALTFWSGDYSEAPEHRKLVERMAGKSFAFLGVNCDRDPARALATVEKCQITWPTFSDGRDGPISTAWNVHKWLSTFVLDRKGVIRYRDVRDRELVNAVETLLRE